MSNNAWQNFQSKSHSKGNEKFENACRQIQDSVEKYLKNHNVGNLENEESDEENFMNDSVVIERILRGYDSSQDLGKIEHHLQEALRSGSLICLICIENIKRVEFIWNCEKCFSSFHLDCIQKWAKDSIYLHSKSDSSIASSISKWFCPKCRGDYSSSEIPFEYKCFCGKEKEPQFDPWLIPHSCGEKCGKKLKPYCGHNCLILCHPGPCPPCPVTVSSPCYCSKSRKQTRRCSNKEWSCGDVCLRLLSCSHHQCQLLCHDGPCPTCSQTSVQSCKCGSTSQLRSCSDVDWQCEKVCGKYLSCGHHTCEIACHDGPCKGCPYGGIRACPCGKKMFDLPCTEPVPTCGDTCSKSLSCGVHFCAERCHKGSCPTCLQFLLKRCNCGAKEKELPCAKNYTCDVKCKRIKDCRRHVCNRRCCTGDCPSCEHPCGKTLGCGQHKCQSRCHQMRCYPCTVTHKISCTCGHTSIVVPCGRERKTPPPKCSKLCMKPPICHHPKADPHKCHAGSCPQCKIICNYKLPCKHNCPAPCHDAVPIKIVDNHKPVGPWDKIPPRIEIQKLSCPPCKFPVPNTCLGNHETSDWACSDVRPFSCGRVCGRLLDCSHHRCELECHLVLDSIDGSSQGSNCKPCESQCLQNRPKDCSHKCSLPCHAGPCPTCRETVRRNCHCGLLQMYVKCDEWVSMDSDTKEKILSCTNQCNKSIKCGHPCNKECHSGPCSSVETCEVKTPVRCPCKRIKKMIRCSLIKSSENGVISCNEMCRKLAAEKKQKEDEEEKVRLLQEEMAKRKEMKEYGKFLFGHKKRKRNRMSSTDDVLIVPIWKTKIFISSFVVVCLIALILGIVFTYSNEH